jgi:hypothetical protein
MPTKGMDPNTAKLRNYVDTPHSVLLAAAGNKESTKEKM